MSLKHTVVRPSDAPGMTVAIDPGTYYAGVAVFFHKKLVHGSKVTVEKRRNMCDQALALSKAVLVDIMPTLDKEPMPSPSSLAACSLLCEGQEHRKAKNQKGDQNTLIHLAVNTGCLLAYLSPRLGAHGATGDVVPPSTWKGTLAKDIKLNQIKRTLTDEERALTRNNEHVLDAAGIGLWWLQRLP